MKGNGGGGKSAEQTKKEFLGISLDSFEAKHVFVGLERGGSDAKDQNEPEEENEPKAKKKRKKINEDEDAIQEKKARPKKFQKVQKGSIEAHGRSVLDNTSFKEHVEPSKRLMGELSRKTKELQKKHGTRSLDCGTLKGNSVIATMTKLAEIVNVVHVYAQKAAFFLIERVMAGPMEHHYLLQEMVTSGTLNDGGNSFWMNLCNFVCTGESKSSQLIMKHFMKMDGSCSFVIPGHYRLGFKNLSRLLENNAANLAANFRGQVVGRISILIAKVLANDADNIEEITTILKSFCARPTAEGLSTYLQNENNGRFFFKIY